MELVHGLKDPVSIAVWTTKYQLMDPVSKARFTLLMKHAPPKNPFARRRTAALLVSRLDAPFLLVIVTMIVWMLLPMQVVLMETGTPLGKCVTVKKMRRKMSFQSIKCCIERTLFVNEMHKQVIARAYHQ